MFFKLNIICDSGPITRKVKGSSPANTGEKIAKFVGGFTHCFQFELIFLIYRFVQHMNITIK